jgi:hypothetical protein
MWHQTYTNSKMPFRHNGNITVNEEQEQKKSPFAVVKYWGAILGRRQV